MLIDAIGLGCPKPVIMAEEALSRIDEGIVNVLVDNEASVKNLSRFASKSGFYSEASGEDGRWLVKIVKGYPCEPSEDRRQKSPTEGAEAEVRSVESGPSPGPVKEMMLIVASDVMGRDEELGKVLMKAFFETMLVTKEVPHTIFLLNAAVRLSTVNEEIVPILKQFEGLGVEIFSCGTCLKFYDLESKLKVGYRGTSNHIVEGMKDFKKTVWIG